MIRDKSVESMVAASVYAACRKDAIPRSLDDVAKSANVSKKTLSRCYRVLLSGLNMKFDATASVDYIVKIASSVGATEKAKRIAYKISHDFRDTRKHVGKTPSDWRLPHYTYHHWGLGTTFLWNTFHQEIISACLQYEKCERS